ncbi:MAG TPA: hydroxyacylglutathione hydrolase [Phycisphaerales bacterium]|nr:hydroxyacylglutathione hydrolase [Phycisphaerales bacterium]
MQKIITIPALGDNFIYLCEYEAGRVFVVDPGEARSVVSALEKHCLELSHILITHNHFDHCGGVAALVEKFGCEVITPSGEIDRTVSIGLEEVTVIATPGHTAGSVCYYLGAVEKYPPVVFTGDTLFVSGCGRIFECSAKTMYDSLLKLASLDDETVVYPGHDYTDENYRFALQFDGDNKIIRERLIEIKTDPTSAFTSTVGLEKQTNPFLRASLPGIKAALDMAGATDVETFAELRRRKNSFG